jgi:hypothetical protein
MFRFWLPPILALMSVFSAFTVLLTWQPYHNPALQDLLPPPAQCTAPCWGGIRPGVTTVSEATDLLRQHDWVAEVEFTATTPPGGGTLVWHWKPAAAPIVDRTRPGTAGILRGRVSWMQIPTTLALGDMWLARGTPATAVTLASMPSHNRVHHYVMYHEQSVQWRSIIGCPWRTQTFWRARVELWLGVSSPHETPTYHRPTRAACRNG